MEKPCGAMKVHLQYKEMTDVLKRYLFVANNPFNNVTETEEFLLKLFTKYKLIHDFDKYEGSYKCNIETKKENYWCMPCYAIFQWVSEGKDLKEFEEKLSLCCEEYKLFSNL